MFDWSGIRYFKPEEFSCKCGCEGRQIQLPLVEALDALRHLYGKPMTITSGYRCPQHNEKVSSTGKTGPHTTGLAADIGVSGREAVVLLRLALSITNVQGSVFTGIGIQQKGAGRFLHLDMIPDSASHKRPWMWSY